MVKKALSNPGRALGLTAKRATSAVFKIFKQALTTLPDLKTFYNFGKGLHLDKIVRFFTI